jgi:hypothetical protein
MPAGNAFGRTCPCSNRARSILQRSLVFLAHAPLSAARKSMGTSLSAKGLRAVDV